MDISVDLGCHTSVLSYHLHLFIFETKVEWVGWIDFYFLLILRKKWQIYYFPTVTGGCGMPTEVGLIYCLKLTHHHKRLSQIVSHQNI